MANAKEKKLAVITLSQQFMKNHPKAGQPTDFVAKLKAGKKIHTIRGNYEWWAKKAAQINAGLMELSVRVWSGKPYQSKQVEVARFTKLGVQRITAKWSDGNAIIEIDGMRYPSWMVAHNDGLEQDEWLHWFYSPDPSFRYDGVVLHFTDFRY